jgi:hypothetical protein
LLRKLYSFNELNLIYMKDYILITSRKIRGLTFRAQIIFLPLLSASIFFAPSDLKAQGDVQVALIVSEDTGGLIQSNISSALRSLGDVQFVETNENPDVVLVVVVLCEGGDCRNTRGYSVSVSVERPIQAEPLGIAIQNEVDIVPRYLSYQDIERISSRLWEFRTTETSWALFWGRQRYEQAIRELVARIDTDCFDTVRMSNRWWEAARSGDRNTANRLEAQMIGRLCF